MRSYSCVMVNEVFSVLREHLIREDKQEDLCFITYVLSTGKERTSAILRNIILPEEGERIVHGAVSFLPKYFERVIHLASTQKVGIALIHSHLTEGWQGMSNDDVIAESRISPSVYGATGLPLIGLTMGTDGALSGRFWIKDEKKRRVYERKWCESVRVVGSGYNVTFNDNLLQAKSDNNKQLRTISGWGQAVQDDISRLKIGIVGLGSVGSQIAENLARIGVSNFTLIDFDTVEEKNLDRLTNVFYEDVGRAKVDAIASGISKSATTPDLNVDISEYSICEHEGFLKALDCDVLFSSVDRPWARQVLNFVSYAHLIPVIDGGILVRTNRNNTKMVGADWKAHTIGYEKACLECLAQYKTEHAILEREGFWDDPSYIKGLDNPESLDVKENVFPFSSHLASMEVLQLLSMIIKPSGISNVGQQVYHFSLGSMESYKEKTCDEGCFFQSIVGTGDTSGVIPYDRHIVAELARSSRLEQFLKKTPN